MSITTEFHSLRLTAFSFILLLSYFRSFGFTPASSFVDNGRCRSRIHAGRYQSLPRLQKSICKSNGSDESDQDVFSVRRTRYSDLGAVSDVILSSFYTDPKSPWRQMYRLGELNRLQQNFPYDDELHAMYVAVCSVEDTVIGFVDVDARPSKRKQDPPRPYLSDLAVHPHYRRRGIARKLVETCEDCTRRMGKGQLFIRVALDNEPANRMYKTMAYESHPHEVFGVNDNTVLLRKTFGGGEHGNLTEEDSSFTLDYIV